MSTNFQSSFIPKEPVTTSEIFQKKNRSLFGSLIFLLFILSVVISLGLFVYKMMVKSQLDDLKNQLVEAEKNLDRETVKNMSDFSKRLNFAKNIVSNHVVVSNFLNHLASSTVGTVYYSDFAYDTSSPQGVAVSMKGLANSYSSVALQESVFLKDKYFRKVNFSNLALTDKGMVSFDLSVIIDKEAISYSPIIPINDSQVSVQDSASEEQISNGIEEELEKLESDLKDIESVPNINNL